MSELPAFFSLVLTLTMAASFVWIFSEVGRRTAVRGSAARFYWATVEHGTRYPALLYLCMSIATEMVYGTLLYVLFDSVAVALWAFVLWEKKRDGEDDDYWKHQKKRLKKWVSSLGSRTATAPGAA